MKEKLKQLKLKTHVRIYSFTEIAGMLIFLIGTWRSEFENVHPLVWIGILIVALGIFWCFTFVKCPQCGSGLYYLRHIPKYCPDCGKELHSPL